GAGNDVDVFGDAPNIAARVQAAAPPDTLLITSATHRLLSRTFATEDYGAKILKGVDTPIQLYRAVQPSGVPGRFHLPAVQRELSPFVGRDEELLLLINRWEQATSGEGQVVFIVGEAGIGKSRLLQEFRGRLDVASHTWVECAGEQFFESTPFHAISQAL